DSNLELSEIKSVSRDVAYHLKTIESWCKRPCVDRGIGFCELLIRGEAANYFSIMELPQWILARFRRHRAITETFLSQFRGSILGDSRIGQATFEAMPGRDLFVSSLRQR